MTRPDIDDELYVDEPANNLAGRTAVGPPMNYSRVSWQFVAWVLGILLTIATTYQATAAQFQATLIMNEKAIAANRERISVVEARYDEISRRLNTLDRRTEDIQGTLVQALRRQ